MKIKKLETERTRLKNLTILNATKKYLSWLKNKKINKFLETKYVFFSLSKLKKYIQNINKSQNEILLGIFFKKNNEHIGNIKISKINKIHKRAEIGIIIGDTKFQNKGIGQEVIRCVTMFLLKKMKIKKVTAGMYILNKQSIKSFKKAGFFKEAQLKKHWKFQNKMIDGLLLAKIQK